MKYIKRHAISRLSLLLDNTSTTKCVFFIGPNNSGKTKIALDALKKLKWYGSTNNLLKYHLIQFANKKRQRIKSIAVLQHKKIPYFLDNLENNPLFLKEIKITSAPLYFMATCLNTEFVCYAIKKFIETFTQNIVIIMYITYLSASEIYNRKNFAYFPNTQKILERKINFSDTKLLSTIIKGGVPSIRYLNIQQQRFYLRIILKNIYKEINSFWIRIHSIQKFNRFLFTLAKYANKPINFKKISKIINIDTRTLHNWLYALIGSQTITIIKPLPASNVQRLSKSLKIIFNDSGLLCFLLQCHNQNALKYSQHFDDIFKNYCISEIIKGHINDGNINITDNIFYARDINHTRKNIDLIIQNEDHSLIPIIISNSSSINNKLIKNISILKSVSNICHKLTIFYRSECPFTECEDAIHLPITWI